MQQFVDAIAQDMLVFRRRKCVVLIVVFVLTSLWLISPASVSYIHVNIAGFDQKATIAEDNRINSTRTLNQDPDSELLEPVLEAEDTPSPAVHSKQIQLQPGPKENRSDNALRYILRDVEEIRTKVHFQPTTFGSAPSAATEVSPLTSSEIEAILAKIQSAVQNMRVDQLQGLPTSRNISLLPNYKNPCWMSEEHYDTEESRYRQSRLRLQRTFRGRHRTRRIRAKFLDKTEDIRHDGFTCLPYFFIAGFPKSGTTDLFAKLLKHPQVLRGRTKEPHFWTRGRFRWKSFGFYQMFFSRAIAQIQNVTTAAADFHPMVMTEGSASTVWDNEYIFKSNHQPSETPPHLNIHALHSVHPSAKFVLILRNPRDRLYSDYLFFQKSFSPEEFHHQVQCALRMLTTCLRDPRYHPLYCIYAKFSSTMTCRMLGRLRIGLYYIHISILLSVYPKESVYITRLETYARQKVDILRDIYRFLDLEPMDMEALRLHVGAHAYNSNRSGYKKAGGMLNATRTLLDQFYQPFNDQLSKLLKNEDFRYE